MPVLAENVGMNLRLAVFTPFFAALLLTFPSAHAAADMAVTLLAPDLVRPLLVAYLDLPPSLAGEDAAAVLTRRVRGPASDLLAAEGYFTPHIAVRRTADEPAGLVVDVDPGPPTRVDEVALEFLGEPADQDAEQIARRERLRADWSLKAGAVFRSADWEAAKSSLLTAFAAADHAGARIVDSRAEVDPVRATAKLAVTLDGGPAYRFGPVVIEGLKRYNESLVRRLVPFAPGDAYRRDALLSLQTRLQNTPWFNSVIIEFDPATAVGDRVPVKVTLAETPAQRIGFGLGYGTNSGARGEINYRHHDFLGRAWDLNSGLRVDQKSQSVFADLALVPDQRGYRLGFGARAESSDIEGLLSQRQVLAVTRSRIAGLTETRLSLEWQREERRPDGALAETDDALILDWRWTRRAVDDVLNPRLGNVIEFQIGGASKRLLSDQDFVRTRLRVQQWWPVGKASGRDTLSLRGEAGLTAANSRLGIPQDYLFRVGGGQTVRGHAYQSLGVSEGNAVVGGRALLVGSVEYTRWLRGPWGMALFVDVGDAADRWRDLKPAVGAGVGLRWQSPAGPLAFDLARGSRSGRWYPHFALMVAF
jgi:translocation and assembly module TamA